MECRRSFYSLGTYNELYALGADCEKAADAAVKRVLEIDDEMSAFKPGSEISKISQNAGRCGTPVGDDVFFVLSQALAFSQASGGAFDITVRPLTKLWNFGNEEKIPGAREIRRLLRSGVVSRRNLVLDSEKKTAYLKKSGCSIDLGGIAKGYAADEAKRILLEHGVRCALIDFGGNIAAVGKNPQGGKWKIGIQNPLSVRGTSFMSLEAQDESVVTSAVNERFFIKDGRRYHHILDARTGYPAQSGLMSVTVLDASSLRADALSTAAFVLGLGEGGALIKSMGAKAVFITESGDVYSTSPDIAAQCPGKKE